ncbi:MAG TPA: SDR family oxidoreductase, partial [Caulobacteraceae bacterium]|nr:SDR family oxidoreductase [Caulobacteraceae bacterium]
TAERFAAEGAQVAILDANGAGAQDVARSIGAAAFATDVTDEESVAAAVEGAAKAMGGLDGLVNAAGIVGMGAVEGMDTGMWRRVLDVNLTGPFLICRAAAPVLRKALGATVVNIASGVGLSPTAERSAYAASKAGLITFTKVLAMEWAPDVRVNTICPGSVDTPMLRGAYSEPAVMARIIERYALKRLAKAEELASAILFLTSNESSYVTGATLAVDGGRTFH